MQSNQDIGNHDGVSENQSLSKTNEKIGDFETLLKTLARRSYTLAR
jgi:hypothetical protein